MRGYPYFYAERATHIHSLVAAYGIIIGGDDTPGTEGKSYRMFSEWLVEEAYYLRTFLQLSQHIPHFTTLQKFTERISGTLLEKVMSSFIILTKDRQLFIGIDSSGFKATHASQYYAERVKLYEEEEENTSLNYHCTADVVQQIICNN